MPQEDKWTLPPLTILHKPAKTNRLALRNLLPARPTLLTAVLGQSSQHKTQTLDLRQLGNILVVGNGMSASAAFIHVTLTGFLLGSSPDDMRLVLADESRVELAPYREIPHLLTPILEAPEKCVSALKWSAAEGMRRLKVLAQDNCRNIDSYNARHPDTMPHIVVVLAETSDLLMMAESDVEALTVHIAKHTKNTGIHMVIATEYPQTGLTSGMKQFITSRIDVRMPAPAPKSPHLLLSTESMSDPFEMLIRTPFSDKPSRAEGAQLSMEDTVRLCDSWSQQAKLAHDNEVLSQPVSLGGRRDLLGSNDDEDSLVEEAIEVVRAAGSASTSLLQRKLIVGYSRASRLMDILEERGVVGPSDGTGRPRSLV